MGLLLIGSVLVGLKSGLPIIKHETPNNGLWTPNSSSSSYHKDKKVVDSKQKV